MLDLACGLESVGPYTFSTNISYNPFGIVFCGWWNNPCLNIPQSKKKPSLLKAYTIHSLEEGLQSFVHTVFFYMVYYLNTQSLTGIVHGIVPIKGYCGVILNAQTGSY